MLKEQQTFSLFMKPQAIKTIVLEHDAGHDNEIKLLVLDFPGIVLLVFGLWNLVRLHADNLLTVHKRKETEYLPQTRQEQVHAESMQVQYKESSF